MTKLSDLHYVLLAIAAKRANGSIGVTRAGLTRAINTLVKHGLAQEADTADENSVWRVDGKRKVAAVITDAGQAAVAEADGKKPEESTAASSAAGRLGGGSEAQDQAGTADRAAETSGGRNPCPAGGSDQLAAPDDPCRTHRLAQERACDHRQQGGGH